MVGDKWVEVNLIGLNLELKHLVTEVGVKATLAQGGAKKPQILGLIQQKLVVGDLPTNHPLTGAKMSLLAAGKHQMKEILLKIQAGVHQNRLLVGALNQKSRAVLPASLVTGNLTMVLRTMTQVA